jgi:uncharacterized membrane protein YfcA
MNDELELLGLAGLGFAVGTYGTIVGLGGGFILVPVLLFLYPDYDPDHLTAISLFVVWTNTTSGSIANARQGRIDYLTGLLFAASSAPGVLAGVFLVDFLPQRVFAIVFALLLLVLAAVAVRGPPRGIRQPLSGRGVIIRQMVTAEGTYRYGYRLWQGVILSLGVGLISSVLGIGGGAVHVPVMISTLHFPVMLATATSQFILAFMSGGASVVHLAKGTLSGDQMVKAAALGLGTLPGAQLGARLAGRMKARTVIKMLVAGLLVLSFRLFLKGIAGS